MSDKIRIDPCVELTAAEWSSVWTHVFRAFAGADPAPDFGAAVPGAIPTAVVAAVRDQASEVHIQPRPRGSLPYSVSIYMDRVAPGLVLAYERHLGASGWTLLARSTEAGACDDAGTSDALYAGPNHALAVNEDVPEDDEAGSNATLFLQFGDAAERAAFGDAWISAINSAIFARLPRVAELPRGQIERMRERAVRLLADIDAVLAQAA